MVLQARLKIRHHGCVSEKVVSGARIVHMSGDNRRCLSIFKATSPQNLEELLHGNRRVLEDDGFVDRGEDWAIAHCHCPQQGSQILPLFKEHGCTIIWPAIEADGHEFYTVLAPSRKRFKALCERLGEEGDVNVERISNVPGPALDINVSMSGITENLTRRQLDALTNAVAAGYYDTPRRAYADALAAQMGMSRSTYQEHLQKAESTVMKTFASLILEHQALGDMATKGRGRPRKRPHEIITGPHGGASLNPPKTETTK